MTGNQIRDLRKRLRLSGDVFAAALGLTGKHRGLTVYKWEYGKKNPSSQTVLLMNMLRQGLEK